MCCGAVKRKENDSGCCPSSYPLIPPTTLPFLSIFTLSFSLSLKTLHFTAQKTQSLTLNENPNESWVSWASFFLFLHSFFSGCCCCSITFPVCNSLTTDNENGLISQISNTLISSELNLSFFSPSRSLSSPVAVAMEAGEDCCVKVAVHIRPLIGDEKLQGCKDCVTVVPGKPQVPHSKKKSVLSLSLFALI